MVYYQFNDNNALPIRAQVSGSTYHYPNITPSEIYTAYNSVPSRKNDGYNTIIMTKYGDGEYYSGVYGIHLPSDRIIDIDTETNNYMAFHWDGMAATGTVNDDWGSNSLYSHSAKINSDDTNFNLNGTVYNQYGGAGHYTVEDKYWIYTSWWAYSENTPLQIYTTVPLYNIRVNGQPLVPIKTEILKTPRNTSLIEINTVIRDIKTALLHKYGRDDIEDPVVNSIEISNYVDATIYYKIDTRIMYSYEYCKLVIKKNAIPVNKEDGDKILDVSPYNIKIKVTDLDDSSRYFVKIFVEDTNGTIAMSAAKVFKTGTIYNFDYTGQIQTFVVPETGIYSLETWGAQGGNAEDGNNSARGGYGSYSYGEIALQKGETLYINVGGQNGYGGGGYSVNPPDEYKTQIDLLNDFSVSAFTYPIYEGSPSGLTQWDNRNLYSYVTTHEYGFNLDPFPVTCFNIINAYVNKAEGSNNYILSFSNISTVKCFVNGTGSYHSGSGYFSDRSQACIYLYQILDYSYDATYLSTRTFTGDNALTQAIDFLAGHFRNINLFVNGTCWVLADTE